MNIKRASLLYILFWFLLGLTSCATYSEKLYRWNNYDKSLYQYYSNPGELSEYIESLNRIILKAEESDMVPPGIYAELGFALYEVGNITGAITYFQKEYDKWPESRILMQKMIRNARSISERQIKVPQPFEHKSIDDR